ncbi:MAG: glycosyltransferase family 2 protein, partial [Pedobacter sp.]
MEETIGCINSALNAKNKTPHRIIVINDASPNTALTVALRSHVQDHSYVLLENAENLGFVGTINRGIALSEDRDVILLNSDTVVPDHWIDQLFAVAYSDPIIGTVTPFSNNATICSYPRFCQDNAILAGHDVNTLNRIFFEVNGISNIDIPTAHGFCMLIKRAVVDNIGYFDHQKWGKGYGEENDFSLRAEKHGWRNAMALGTFVQHHGSVSFAGNKEEFIKKNLKILEGMYPDYTLRVLQFIKNDPVRKARNAVTRALLKRDESTKKRTNKRVGRNILFITLNIGGGTSVATSSLSSQLAREGVGTLYLTSQPDGNWRLSKYGDDHGMDYCHKSEFPQLMADLRA